jgi:hypothetical protein
MDSVLTIQNLLCFINSGAVLAFWQSAMMSTYEQEYSTAHGMSVSLSCSSQSASSPMQQDGSGPWLARTRSRPRQASVACSLAKAAFLPPHDPDEHSFHPSRVDRPLRHVSAGRAGGRTACQILTEQQPLGPR